jgi:hypothetical protein
MMMSHCPQTRTAQPEAAALATAARGAQPTAVVSAAQPGAAAPAAQRSGRNPLVPAAIAVVIVGIQALFVFCLGYPLLHASPHGVPIGTAGPPAAVARLEAALDRQPGAFDVHAYDSAAAARSAIRDRDVDGAVVATRGGPTLLVASAADPAIASMLTSQAKDLGSPVTVADLVPAAGKDPQQIGALATLLPLILLSIALGALLGHTERRRRLLLAWCAAASTAAGLAAAGIGSALGTFPGSYLARAGVLALLVLGLSTCSAGLVSVRRLRPVEGLFAMTMIFLGIPSAGALIPPELLTEPWRAMGPWLPPAAALNAMRGITFFGGAATASPLAVLGGWAALGVLLVAVPAVVSRRARTAPEAGQPSPVSAGSRPWRLRSSRRSESSRAAAPAPRPAVPPRPATHSSSAQSASR